MIQRALPKTSPIEGNTEVTLVYSSHAREFDRL